MSTMQKRIIFVGKSGSGKSTASAALCDGEDNLFHITDSSKGVTKACVCKVTKKFIIYDTVGLGEPPNGAVPNNIAIDIISLFIRGKQFDYICVVKNSTERIDLLDKQVFASIKNIFSCNNDKIVLLLTKCSNEWVEREKIHLNKIYGNIPMFAADFSPVIDKMTLRIMKRSLERFKNWLLMLNFTYNGIIPIIQDGVHYKFIRNTFGSKGFYIGKVCYIKDKIGCVLITNYDDNNAFWHINQDKKDINIRESTKSVMQLVISQEKNGNVVLTEDGGDCINVKIEYAYEKLNGCHIPILYNGGVYKVSKNTFDYGYYIVKLFEVVNQHENFFITDKNDEEIYLYAINSYRITLNRHSKPKVVKLIVDYRHGCNIVIAPQYGCPINVRIEEKKINTKCVDCKCMSKSIFTFLYIVVVIYIFCIFMAWKNFDFS